MSNSQQTSEELQDRWNKIAWPKHATELHVHLGGSVPLYRLWEIAVTRGIRGLGNGYEEFIQTLRRDRDRIASLDEYLEVYDRVELIQSGPDAVRESVTIAIHRAYLDGGTLMMGQGGEPSPSKPLFAISRLELRFNPLKRTGAVFLKGKHAGLYDVDRIIRAAATAISDCEIGFRGSIQTGLLFCFGRDMTYEANCILAKKVRTWVEEEESIVGVDLAGPESVNPLSDPHQLKRMKEVFDLVGPKLGRTIHVGETPHVDLKTFINTVETLEPTRVAHPIVAARSYLTDKNPDGLKVLQERGIVCELCVHSNLLTGAVNSLEEYGELIKVFDEFQIPYTFSTDAPSLQVTTLASELHHLFMAGGITEDQILRSFETADKSSFLPSE
ncbi:MAG: hypothetical protein KDD70_12985 [Bdellovibrionales bacterium]|nr:hypothetical protein [Bdellovibrionales bacterium]